MSNSFNALRDHSWPALGEQLPPRSRPAAAWPSPTYKSASGFQLIEMPVGLSLFSAPNNADLAHCVGADFRMSAGIATQFKTRFGKQEELLRMNKIPGQVATLRSGNNHIHYLVTKQFSNILPDFCKISECIDQLFIKCTQINLRLLAILRISCMCDGQAWGKIKSELIKKGKNSNITALVYQMPQFNRRQLPSRSVRPAPPHTLSHRRAPSTPVQALATTLTPRTRTPQPHSPSAAYEPLTSEVTVVSPTTATVDLSAAPQPCEVPGGSAHEPLTPEVTVIITTTDRKSVV